MSDESWFKQKELPCLTGEAGRCAVRSGAWAPWYVSSMPSPLFSPLHHPQRVSVALSLPYACRNPSTGSSRKHITQGGRQAEERDSLVFERIIIFRDPLARLFISPNARPGSVATQTQSKLGPEHPAEGMGALSVSASPSLALGLDTFLCWSSGLLTLSGSLPGALQAGRGCVTSRSALSTEDHSPEQLKGLVHDSPVETKPPSVGTTVGRVNRARALLMYRYPKENESFVVRSHCESGLWVTQFSTMFAWAYQGLPGHSSTRVPPLCLTNQ